MCFEIEINVRVIIDEDSRFSITIKKNTNAKIKQISEDISELITVFPNPIQDRISIRTNLSILDVQLISISGKTIKITMDQSKKEIEIRRKLREGIYFLIVKTDRGTEVRKLLAN